MSLDHLILNHGHEVRIVVAVLHAEQLELTTNEGKSALALAEEAGHKQLAGVLDK